MAHTIIPPPRCTAATLELTHKGNINDQTITEGDWEVKDFNFSLLACVITRSRHLEIDTHRTNLEVTRQACHYIHEMIVTVNRTCVLLASEDMITQRIDNHLVGAKRVYCKSRKRGKRNRNSFMSVYIVYWIEVNLKILKTTLINRTWLRTKGQSAGYPQAQIEITSNSFQCRAP